MAKYEEENIKQIPRILKLNEKKIILIMYDECIFYLNNGKRGVQAKFRVAIIQEGK